MPLFIDEKDKIMHTHQIIEKNKTNTYWLFLQIGIALFYVSYFWVITTSGYSADDMWNSNVWAHKFNGEISAWGIMREQFLIWFRLGRVFPFSQLVALFFAVVPGVFLYKLCILLSIYANALLGGMVAYKATRSRLAQGGFMLVFPLFVQLTPEFDSGIYCFHMLIQSVVFFCLLALYALQCYCQSKKMVYLLLCGVAYFIALGTYEVAYVFVFVLMGVILLRIHGWRERIKAFVPTMVAGALMGGANVYAKLNQVGAYDGITINLAPREVLVTWLKQCSTCFPLGRYICSGLKECVPYSDVYPYTLTELVQGIHWLDVMAVGLFVAVAVGLGYVYGKKEDRQMDSTPTAQGLNEAATTEEQGIKGWVEVLLLGMVMFLLPGVLIAISIKYQQLLGWCSGHLPAYMQSVGVAFIVVAVMGILSTKIKGKSWVGACGIGIALVIIFLNMNSGRAGVEYMNQARRYPQDNLSQGFAFGFFEAMGIGGESGEDAPCLVGMTSYIYDESSSPQFYSKFASDNIRAIPRQDFFALAEQEVSLEQYYGVFNQSDKHQGAIICGRIVEACPEEGEVWVKDPLVYVRGPLDPAMEKLLVSGEKMKSQGQEAIYRLPGEYNIYQEAEYYESEYGTGVLYRQSR